MTGRDRIVVVVLAALAVVAAAWLLVLAPEREKASKLGAEVSTAQSQLSAAACGQKKIASILAPTFCASACIF